jgi:hypothetical protein
MTISRDDERLKALENKTARLSVRDSNAIEIGTKGREAFMRLLDGNEKNRAIFALDRDGQTEFRTLDGTGAVIRQMTLSTPEK